MKVKRKLTSMRKLYFVLLTNLRLVSGKGIERYASCSLYKRKILFTADKKTSVQIDEFFKCGNGVAVPVRCTVFQDTFLNEIGEKMLHLHNNDIAFNNTTKISVPLSCCIDE